MSWRGVLVREGCNLLCRVVVSIHSPEEALRYMRVKHFAPGLPSLEVAEPGLQPGPRPLSVMSPPARDFSLSPSPGRLSLSLATRLPPPPPGRGNYPLQLRHSLPLSVWLLSWNESHFPVLSLSNPATLQDTSHD